MDKRRKWRDEVKGPYYIAFESFKESVHSAGTFDGVVNVLNALNDLGLTERGLCLEDAPKDPRFYDCIGETLWALKEKARNMAYYYNVEALLRKFFKFMGWPLHAALISRRDRYEGKYKKTPNRSLPTPIKFLLAAVDRGEPLNSMENRKRIYWLCRFGKFFTRGEDASPEMAKAQIHNFLERFGQDFDFDRREGGEIVTKRTDNDEEDMGREERRLLLKEKEARIRRQFDLGGFALKVLEEITEGREWFDSWVDIERIRIQIAHLKGLQNKNMRDFADYVKIAKEEGEK